MAAAQLAQAGGANAMTMLQNAAAGATGGSAAAAPANPTGDFAPRTVKSKTLKTVFKKGFLHFENFFLDDGAAQVTQGGMPRPVYSGGSYEDPVPPASSGR